MKIYSSALRTKFFFAFLLCFSCLNFSCEETNPNQEQGIPIESLVQYSVQTDYDECLKECEKVTETADRERCIKLCEEAKKAVDLTNLRNLERIIDIDFPVPPNPCYPSGNCNDLLEFLNKWIYPENLIYLVSVVNPNSGQLLARNDHQAAVPSNSVKGYVTTPSKIAISNYSGLAKVEIKNPRTNKVHTININIGKSKQ